MCSSCGKKRPHAAIACANHERHLAGNARYASVSSSPTICRKIIRPCANAPTITSRRLKRPPRSSLGNSPGHALRSEAARGGLTPWSVDQIGKLLEEIDLRHYGRTQPIYHHEDNGTWKQVYEEYFISFEDLHRERFPKLDLITPEHLFMALCEMLDQRLLVVLTEKPETIAGRAIWLNLSVRSIMGSVFTQFIRNIPHNKRNLIGFELHRGDLFQDFGLTLDAIAALQREGFKVAIDSITPDMAHYLNLAAFNVDYIKINVSKDRAAQLDDPIIKDDLARIPPEKLIFFRCDNERALAVGLELGVRYFQGWLIDDAAHGKRPH